MWISAICYTLEGKYICTNKSDRFLVCTWQKLLQSDYQPIHSNQVLAKLNLCIHIPLALIWQADALALNWENWFHLSKFSVTFGCIWIHFMMSEFQFTKSESKKIIFLPCFVLPCLAFPLLLIHSFEKSCFIMKIWTEMDPLKRMLRINLTLSRAAVSCLSVKVIFLHILISQT